MYFCFDFPPRSSILIPFRGGMPVGGQTVTVRKDYQGLTGNGVPRREEGGLR